MNSRDAVLTASALPWQGGNVKVSVNYVSCSFELWNFGTWFMDETGLVLKTHVYIRWHDRYDLV